MDDPWGSPWAADDTQLKLDLPAPPPQVHTPHSPHKTASPWGADDEDNAWGGWNGAEGGAGTDSPGWGRSPGLRPARSGTVSRQLSPEPWGRLGMLDVQPDRLQDRMSEKEVPVTGDSAISLGEDPFTADLQSVKQAAEANDTTPMSISVDTQAPFPVSSATNDETRTVSDEAPDRPGSPLGAPSRAVTALDRPEPTRQASKVQELVHMYDGIAKRKDSPNEPLVAGPRIVLIDSAGTKEQEDEMQLEQASHEIERSAREPTLPSEDAHSVDSSGDAPDKKETPEAAEDPGDHGMQIEAAASPSSPRAEIQAPSEPYAHDLKYLDDLFPTTPTPSIDPEPVPDVIIDDTFASISERKAWYRISRRGPIRQHNQGNDEDYVRLDWRSSEVRGRTLQIVRRWMEEDSITGRVVLGRRQGPIGASMFNWDSRAPQVEIGELFGKKSHRRSISGASGASKGSLPSPSSATFAWTGGSDGVASTGKPSLDEPKRNGWIAPPASVVPPIAPSFGWSSAPEENPTAESKAQAAKGTPAIRKIPSPLIAPPPEAMSSLDKMTTGELATESLRNQTIPEGEDDDEWGEMVSSPTWPPHTAAHETQAAIIAPSAVLKVSHAAPPTLSPALGTGSEQHVPPTPSNIHSTNLDQVNARPWHLGDEDWSTAAPDESTQELPASSESLRRADEDSLQTSVGNTPITTAQTQEVFKGASGEKLESLTVADQKVIEEVLRNLPDLSYMLR